LEASSALVFDDVDVDEGRIGVSERHLLAGELTRLREVGVTASMLPSQR
jgi:hypothetical protein